MTALVLISEKHTMAIFYVRRAVDLLPPAKVNTYIAYIFGTIELLSMHAI